MQEEFVARRDESQRALTEREQLLADMKKRVPVHVLPFEVLPRGFRSLTEALEDYLRERNYQRREDGEVEFEWNRVRYILDLNPSDCYVGSMMWVGYFVFEFAWMNEVVLECPTQGNAIYVLSRDWRRYIGVSRSEIIADRIAFSRKITHKGDWLNRLAEHFDPRGCRRRYYRRQNPKLRADRRGC